MKGSITKRGDKTYLLRLYLGRTSTGKRKYHTQTYHGTKKEAEKILRELVARYEGGGVMAPSREGLTAYLAEWMELAKVGKVSEKTVEVYRNHIRLYISPYLGELPLSRISVTDVQGLYQALHAKGLGKSAIKTSHTILNQAFAQAVRWRKIQVNPATDTVRSPTKKTKVVRAMDQETADLFLLGATRTEHSAMFHVALLSGMRPSEYLGLTWDCIDWKNCRLTVNKSVTKIVKEPAFLGPLKTKSSYRSVEVPPNVMAILKEHRRAQLEYRMLAGQRWTDLNLVFPMELGEIRTPTSAAWHFKKILLAVGIPSTFRLYDLRHTIATLLLAAGEDVKVVSEMLGHASVAITLDTYMHVTPGLKARAATTAGNLFF